MIVVHQAQNFLKPIKKTVFAKIFVEKIVKKTMESVSSSEYHMFTTPLDVNINSGNNWGEAH